MSSLRRTHQSEAQRLSQAREQEYANKELEKELRKMKLVEAQSAQDERADAKRQIRQVKRGKGIFSVPPPPPPTTLCYAPPPPIYRALGIT